MILQSGSLEHMFFCQNPFVFAVHHDDHFPAGDGQLQPVERRVFRPDGDMDPKAPWRMYYGERVPGFPAHPHRGFETVTAVVRGTVDHTDGLGSKGRYEDGDVQWMTAGRGLQHAEMFPLKRTDGPNHLELFQIWLSLDSAHRMAEPAYKMLWQEDIPVVTLTDENGLSTKVTVIAGEEAGQSAPLPTPDSWAADPKNRLQIKLYAYKTIRKWDTELNIGRSFDNIKSAIDDLIEAGEKVDLERILKNPLSPMFKSKILVVYYPDDYINVFSRFHVNYFLYKLGVELGLNTTDEMARQALLDFKSSNNSLGQLSNFDFSRFLYHAWKRKYTHIRILPINANCAFPDNSVVSTDSIAFTKKLIGTGGILHFKGSVNAENGALILFQLNKAVIASVVLKKSTKKENSSGEQFVELIFRIESFMDFDPISAEDIREIDEGFQGFSNQVQSFDAVKQDDLLLLIEGKKTYELPQEITSSNETLYPEGKRSTIEVVAIERNPKARKACIQAHGHRCAICDFSFGDFYGPDFEGSIEVHHITPLSAKKDSSEVDAIIDLIPVCPNCHTALHLKKHGVYSIEEIRSFIEEHQGANAPTKSRNYLYSS